MIHFFLTSKTVKSLQSWGFNRSSTEEKNPTFRFFAQISVYRTDVTHNGPYEEEVYQRFSIK